MTDGLVYFVTVKNHAELQEVYSENGISLIC